MALQQSLPFAGITIPAAYIRVDSVYGGKAGWHAVVRVYADAETAATPGAAFVKEFNVSAPYDASNMNAFDLLYEAVKAMPDHETATSV